jgi:hypothetical protein
MLKEALDLSQARRRSLVLSTTAAPLYPRDLGDDVCAMQETMLAPQAGLSQLGGPKEQYLLYCDSVTKIAICK